MLQPEPHIRKIRPAVHGGRLYAELKEAGIDPDRVLDFSVSVNPFGPPEGLAEALGRADLENYPDSDSNRLRERLAGDLGLRTDRIIAGSGSTELIRLAVAAYLGPGRQALIVQPTYAEYATAARLVGAAVSRLTLAEDRDFHLDPDRLESRLRQRKIRVLFLCNPNNPSGEYLPEATVLGLVERHPQTLVVLDEAYRSFLAEPWNSTALLSHPNLLIIRSLTKDYAMAGVRLGYACGAARLISVLNKIKAPWNVSAPAQAAGLFVLAQTRYLTEMRERLAEPRRFLFDHLAGLGLRVIPSQANFCLVKVGDAAALRAALLRQAILVRDCASFGLPDYIRLSVRSLPECRRLIAALTEIGVPRYVR